MKRIVLLFIICFSFFCQAQEKLSKYSQENYNKAVEYYKAKDNQKSIEYFTKVIQSFPKHSNSYLFRGKSYFRSGKFDLARLDFNFLISERKLLEQAYLELAKLDLKLNNIIESKNALNKSLSINSKRAETQFQYGMLMYRIKEIDSAEYHLGIACSLNPKSEIYTNNLAGIKFTQAKYKEALKLYQSIDNDEYTIKIARCYSMLNQTDSALVLLKSLENDEKLGAKISNELGKLMIQSENFEQAINYFEKALSKGSNPEYYINMSVAQIKLKKYKEGILSCEKALKLKSNLKNAHYNIGVCYEGLNDFKRACEAWQEAASLGSEKAINHLNHPNCQDE